MKTETEKKTKSSEIHSDLEGLSFLVVGHVDNLYNNFSRDFVDLYWQSLDEFYFWSYCPFIVYEANYERRFKQYKSIYPDGSEGDFINDELESIKEKDIYLLEKDAEEHGLTDKDLPTPSYLFGDAYEDSVALRFVLKPDDYKRICQTQKRKIEFLQGRLTSIENGSELKPFCNSEDEVVDFSDSKTSEKFVLMHELGLFEYVKGLSNVQVSEAQVASLMSGFCGIRADNLRSLINGSKNGGKNNKLTEINLQKAHKKLISLGIDLEKINR